MRRLLLLLTFLLLLSLGTRAQNRDYAAAYHQLTALNLWPEATGPGTYWGESAYPFYLTQQQIQRRRIRRLIISGRGYELRTSRKDAGDIGREGVRLRREIPEYASKGYEETDIRWRSQYEYDRQGRLLRAEWQDSLITYLPLNDAYTNRRTVLHRYDAAGRLLMTRLDVSCHRCELGEYADRATLFPQHQRVYYFYTPAGQLSRRLTKTYVLREIRDAQVVADSSVRQPGETGYGSRLLYVPYWTQERYRYDAAGRLLAKAEYLSLTDSLLRGPARLISTWAGRYDAQGQLTRSVTSEASTNFPGGWSLAEDSFPGHWHLTFTAYTYRHGRLMAEVQEHGTPAAPLDSSQLRRGMVVRREAVGRLSDDTLRLRLQGYCDTLRYDQSGRLLDQRQAHGGQLAFASRWHYQPRHQLLDFHGAGPLHRELVTDWHRRIRQELVLDIGHVITYAPSWARAARAVPPDSMSLQQLLEWGRSSVFRWQFDYQGGLLRRAELRTAYNRSNYRRQPQDTVDGRVARLLLLPAPGQLSQQVRQVRRIWKDWPVNTYANRLFDRFEYEFYPR